MSHEIVFVAGSPSPTSRSTAVARAFAAALAREGYSPRSYSVKDFDPGDLILGRADAPAVAAFVGVVRASAGIVLSTPVYKATYAGGLKTLVDLIPPDALVGRVGLGIATTRQGAHALEVDRAYHALFGFFRAQSSDSLVVLDQDLEADGADWIPNPSASERIQAAARAFARLADRSGESAQPRAT